MPVKQPSNQSAGRVSLVWSGGVSQRLNGVLKAKQRIIDSEVLRRCSPLIPLRTGSLERSGQVGTVIGSGEVKYTASYARKQYNTKTSREYDHRRGGKWFERMKVANKAQIEKLINDK